MKTFLLNLALVLLLAIGSAAVTAQPGDPQGKSRKTQQKNTDTQSNTRIPITNDPDVLNKRDTPPIPRPQPVPLPPDTIRKQ